MSDEGTVPASHPHRAAEPAPARLAGVRGVAPLDVEDLQTFYLPVPDLQTREVAPPTVPVAPSPKPRRRGRRFRGIASLLAIALFLCANGLIQLNRRAWDLQSDTYLTLHRVQRCESLGHVPDVLFVGSSRVVYGVDPSIVDSTVATNTGRTLLSCNVGMFGSTFEQDYYTVKRLIEDGFAPKVLVEDLREYNLNVNAASPADTTGSPFAQFLSLTDLSDASALQPDFERQPYRGITTSDYVLGKLLPMYGERVAIYHDVCNGSSVGPCSFKFAGTDPVSAQRYAESDQYGWVSLGSRSIGSFTGAKRTAYEAETRQVYSPEVRNFLIGGHQSDWLAKLVALAQQHHVQVVLASSPLHSWFFSYFPSPDDWPSIVNYWSVFAQQHGVTYLDASQLPTFTDADWWDPEHLNSAGAKAYSAWLATQAVIPTLSGTAARP